MSPRLNAVSNLSTALADIASIDSNAIGVQLLGTVQIPDPFSAYARRYALELQYYTSKLEHEQLVRRSYAELYETFLTQAEIDRKAYELKRELALQPDKIITNREDLRALIEDDTGQRKLEAERRQNILQRRLKALLNSPKKKYRLRPETLPKFDYDKDYSKLSFETGFGLLALKQTAGQIESARADLWQVKLNRYPSLNVNASLPTIFDSQGNNEPDFDDVRLFAGSNKSFEFTGQEARSVRSAEERAQFIQDRIQLDLSNEAYSFKQLKFRYANLLKKEERITRQIAYYQKNPPLASPSLITSRIKEVTQLKDDLENFRNFRRRLELEFWVWDEKHWDTPF